MSAISVRQAACLPLRFVKLNSLSVPARVLAVAPGANRSVPPLVLPRGRQWEVLVPTLVLALCSPARAASLTCRRGTAKRSSAQRPQVRSFEVPRTVPTGREQGFIPLHKAASIDAGCCGRAVLLEGILGRRELHGTRCFESPVVCVSNS